MGLALWGIWCKRSKLGSFWKLITSGTGAGKAVQQHFPRAPVKVLRPTLLACPQSSPKRTNTVIRGSSSYVSQAYTQSSFPFVGSGATLGRTSLERKHLSARAHAVGSCIGSCMEIYGHCRTTIIQPSSIRARQGKKEKTPPRAPRLFLRLPGLGNVLSICAKHGA
eukprot:3937737-Amphidinium_carterae.1